MLLVRVVGLLVVLTLGVCVVLWLVTGDRRWLRFAWQLFRVAVFVVALFLVLLFGERLVAL